MARRISTKSTRGRNSFDQVVQPRGLHHHGVERERVTRPIDAIGTAQHAVAYLAKADPLPVLVLLDVNLPDMPGFELLRLLQRDERFKDVPIIVLTGVEKTADIDRAYQLGANSYLTKPVSFADFQYTIGELKKRWLANE